MSKSEPWSDCFGQPAADMRMAEIHLRRAVRRARRMAEKGVPPSSIYAAARIRDRAAEQTELARQISQALQVCEGRAVFARPRSRSPAATGAGLLTPLVRFAERGFPQANRITLTKSCRCNNSSGDDFARHFRPTGVA
jgi:hypothetical protein